MGCAVSLRASIDLQIAQRCTQYRNFGAEPIGAPDEIAQDVVALGRTPGLDVVQHRRRAGGALLGEKAAVIVYHPSRWRVAFHRLNPGAFLKRRGDEGAAGGCGSDLKARVRVSTEIAVAPAKGGEFRPHFSNNVIAIRGWHPASCKRSGELLAPGLSADRSAHQTRSNLQTEIGSRER